MVLSGNEDTWSVIWERMSEPWFSNRMKRNVCADLTLDYLHGFMPPHFPVPAIAYWYSYDKKHFPLQRIMQTEREFVFGLCDYWKR
jgi:hypothetical protein